MIVETYDELKFYVEMFCHGNSDLLILESVGGYGKSRLVREVMSKIPHVRIGVHATPLSLYTLGYRNRDLPIVFDDVDSLLSDENNVALLKMFAETSETKEISWLTTSSILKKQGIPERYETKSRVIIICNSFNELSKKIHALKDRGHYLIFKPSDEELLGKMNEIKKSHFEGISDEEKQKVYDLIKEYAKFCDFSLRTFVKGVMLYRECNHGKNLDWKSKLLKEMGINNKLVLISRCLDSFESDKERIDMWESNGFSKRSFYDYKAQLLQKCRGF